MNAPTPAAAVAAPQDFGTFELVNLSSILLSDTPMQKLRRQHFDKSSLKDLTDSIKAAGVLQPILLRRRSGSTVASLPFELVAGERRYMASKLAGLQKIPATVRTLTDLQVIEMQVIENNQREGLHELIEAEGFDQLRKPPHNLSPDDIAAKVGKSRRYVFNRLKLCDLCPEGRAAFYDGKISASVAYQVARIAHHDTQREALKELKPDHDGELTSAREAQRIIGHRYMLQLKNAPFPAGDAALCPKAGACNSCPKRTGNQPELFGDVKSADVCTDPKCFKEKTEAHASRQRIAAEKEGRKVISGKEAKALLPYEHSEHPRACIIPTDRCWQDPKGRTYKALLGSEAPQPQLVEHPASKRLIEFWPERQIKNLLAKKLPKSSSGSNPDYKARRERQRVAGLTCDAIVQQIRDKHAGKIGKAELAALAVIVVDNMQIDGAVAKHWQLPVSYLDQRKKVAAFAEKDLQLFLIDAIALHLLEPLTLDRPLEQRALDFLKPLRIDPKQVRAGIVAAAQKEQAAKAAPKKPAPAKAKAKAPAKAKTKKPAAKK